MQNAKDTFYLELQRRIAALNPTRTLVLRGVVRPAVMVEENELSAAEARPDTFRLAWTGLAIDRSGPVPMAAMACEILYATAGTRLAGGMDRGRALAAMDAELATALGRDPRTVVKQCHAADGSVTSPATNVFWSDPTFHPTSPNATLLSRTVTLQVYGYLEAGEL